MVQIEWKTLVITIEIHNPDYFKFLFSNQNIVAHLKVDKEYNNDYKPFLLLKEQYLKFIDETNQVKTDDEKEIDIIRIWSTVHGLASLACQPNVEVSFDWIEKLESNILLK